MWSKEQSALARQRGWDLYTVFDGKTTKPAYMAFDVALQVPTPIVQQTIMAHAKGNDALSLHALRLMYSKGTK